MEKVNIEKGHVLHRKDEPVETVEIILKGGVCLTNGHDITLQAGQGTILGAFHQAGEPYQYDYAASEDSTLIVYDYGSEDDLIAIIKTNEVIAPVMASANMALLNGCLDTLLSFHEDGCELYEELKSAYEDYRNICVQLGITPERYDAVESLTLPEAPEMVSGWQAELCRAYVKQDELLRKSYYTADINFCVGTILQAAQLLQNIQQQMEQVEAYIQETKAKTDEFSREYHMQKAKLDGTSREEAIASGSGDIPAIQNAMDTILAFAAADPEVSEAFRRDIGRFMQAPNQREKSAEMRELRSAIARNFYAIYEAAFYKSREVADIPAEVKMFFLFGFVDENLAGAVNTAALYKHALLWEDDPSGNVLSVYDWLGKIYNGEVLPSKNELDVDWPEYLKEQVRTAAMKQAQADELLQDRKAMVHFELHNMISAANAMTHGSIYSFIPAFSASAVVRPIESCFVSPQRVHEAMDKLRAIDFGCFYRPAFVSYPKLNINRFDYNVEILPYVILMPNFGNRGALWQDIEGRIRKTPAHMVLSVFHAADLDNTIVKMSAQFRWEMCKRIQGAHYSDISDPSLTAEYINYLQFYKKNRNLTGDKKDALKIFLQKMHNNYKNVFVAEYEMYIENEAMGQSRLNKVAREILFRYCTLSEKYRQSLATNVQYQQLIERWNVKQEARQHTMDFLVRKVLTMTEELPEEVKIEMDFLKL